MTEQSTRNEPLLKSGTLSPNPWDLTLSGQNGWSYTGGTRTEDRAPQGCDPSAASSAGMATGDFDAEAAPKHTDFDPSEANLLRAKIGLDKGVHFNFCETGFGMAVVPADRLVDLREIGYLLGVSYMRLASESEMAELFPDCKLGAMPPFGEVFNMPVLVDTSIAENKFIVLNIGTHRDAVRMRFEDYRRLMNPLIGSITADNATCRRAN